MWSLFLGKVKSALSTAACYVKKGMSSSPEVSSSRWNQTIIVVNIVGMLWYLLIRSEPCDASRLSAWRDVAVVLVVNGLLAFGASKLKEGSQQ